MEREAIGKIRQLRAEHRENHVHGELDERAEIIHEVLRGYHGNVKLRLEVISAA